MPSGTTDTPGSRTPGQESSNAWKVINISTAFNHNITFTSNIRYNITRGRENISVEGRKDIFNIF
jgi:hypothetical protein